MTKNSSIEAQWAATFTNLLGTPPEAEAPLLPLGLKSSGETIPDTVEILTPKEMAEADRMTIAGGTGGIVLMEAAGRAVADAVRRVGPAGARVAVLAGPGNNGGDGFVAARLLAAAGYKVSVGAARPAEELKGDAAFAAAKWKGETRPLTPVVTEKADIIVDAIFGAGLDRPVEGLMATTVEAVNASPASVVAVDLPSGISGETGAVLGAAIEAEETVTFFRPKPGHFLMPGRMHTGRLTVVDIGIDQSVLTAIRPRTFHNLPALWTLPPLAVDGHKYSRGHAVVVSGPASRTGAARLAARGALRAGAGLVTVAAPSDAMATHAAHLTAIMLLLMNGPAGLASILADERRNAVVMGPALGVGDHTVALVDTALQSHAAVVLDADGLTSFANRRVALDERIKARSSPVVLTPHEGEFARLFPEHAKERSKVERARRAAAASGAVVVLKGPDTVVAAPDGKAAIATNAPPQLATAGSGDVLAGIVGGLLAQGMEGFSAATAAVWLHGEAGKTRGRGLIAEDIAEALPAVFAALENRDS